MPVTFAIAIVESFILRVNRPSKEFALNFAIAIGSVNSR